MAYMCHKWPRICSTCRKHFSVFSFFMTYHRACNWKNITGATSGSGTAYTSGAHEFTPSLAISGVHSSCYAIVRFMCMLCRSLFVLLSFNHCVVGPPPDYGFWLPLWYLQILIIWLSNLITTLVFSNSSVYIERT